MFKLESLKILCLLDQYIKIKSDHLQKLNFFRLEPDRCQWRPWSHKWASLPVWGNQKAQPSRECEVSNCLCNRRLSRNESIACTFKVSSFRTFLNSHCHKRHSSSRLQFTTLLRLRSYEDVEFNHTQLSTEETRRWFKNILLVQL